MRQLLAYVAAIILSIAACLLMINKIISGEGTFLHAFLLLGNATLGLILLRGLPGVWNKYNRW